MKQITWIGPERLIPSYGNAVEGREFTLPDRMADSFVDQGLAEYSGIEDTAEVKLESINPELEDNNDE